MRDRTCILSSHESPISHYTKRKIGRASITKARHTKGSVFWAEGVRGFLYYEYSKAVEVTCLKIGRKIWMSDDWTYLESLKSFAERANGKVLVAGLGLGIVVHLLVKNPAVTHIDVVDRELDVIRLVQPLLPEDPRIHVHHEDFYAWCDRASMMTDYVPEAVIWDLAVASKDKGLHEGRELPVASLLIHGRFNHMKWDGETWLERKGFTPPKIFVHGLDRDPEGEAFVHTNEFGRARSLYMTGIVSPEMLRGRTEKKEMLA